MAASSSKQKQFEPTLRTLRHGASTSSTRSPAKVQRATASLSVKEQIARRAAKPLIQGRQFKWISPAQKLKEMQVDMERVRDRREMLEGEEEAADDQTHSLFGTGLQRSALINLTLPFIKFSRSVEPKCRSLPLVIHHRDAIVRAICEALKGSQHDVELCGESILDLIPSLLTDLSHLLLPSLPLLLSTLISLTAPSPLSSANPKLLQRVYDVLGALFRDLGKSILQEEGEGGMSDVWEVVRRGLGAPKRAAVEQEAAMDVDELVPTEEPVLDVSDTESDVEEVPIASTSAPVAPPTPQDFTLPPNLRTTPQTRRLLGSAFAFLVRKARSTLSSPITESEVDQLLRLLISDVAGVQADDDGVRKSARGRGAKGRGKGVGKGRGQEEGSSVAYAEGVTWVLVESCSAANQHLHSRTPSILRSALAAVLSLPESFLSASPALPTEIITHTLTALAQHVKDAQAYDIVVGEVVKAVKSALASGADEWDLKVSAMRALETVVAVKKGSRISTSQRQLVFALLSPLPDLLKSSPPSRFVTAYSSLLLPTLLLTTFQDTLAPSGGPRSAVTALFRSEADAITLAQGFALARALDTVAWSQWSSVLGPLVLSATVNALDSTNDGPKEEGFGVISTIDSSLSLLARLAWSGRLRTLVEAGGVAVKSWEKVVGDRCKTLLRTWKQDTASEQENHRLLSVLLIVPQLPSFQATLLPLIVDLALSIASTASSTARTAFLESASSPAQILGASLLAFSRMSTNDNESDRLAGGVVKMIEGFSWHRGVMQGVAGLSLAKTAADMSTDHQSRIYSSVLPNLLSEDSLLRLSSLQIADSLFPSAQRPVSNDLIQRCMEVEQVELSVMGAREKSMKVRKLGIVAHGQLGKDGEKEEEALDVVLRYLTAMMKVNFKPLWPEAIGALSLLSTRYPEPVWAITSRQLLTAATRGSELYISRKPEWATSAASEGADAELVFEEQQLREHSLEEARGLMRKESALFEDSVEAATARDAVLSEAQVAPERLVVQSYEAQLLALFCAIPDLAQKHSRDFVEVFLGCFQRDDDPNAIDTPKYVNQDETAKERKLRLIAWLGLFSKFSNPKALFKSADLGDHFRTLLAFPDPEVQKLALDCLLRWKTPALSANADRLRHLLEPTKLRDELLQFVSSTEAGGLKPEHRADVVPLVIRITYGIMTSRLGRASTSSGQGRAGRRAAILGALKTCAPEELGTLVDLTIGPLRKLLVTKPGEPFRFADHSPNVAGKRQLGFLGFLADLLKHLGKHLVDRWHELMGTTLNLLHFAQKGIEEESKEDDEEVEPVDGEAEDEEEDSGEETQMAPLRHIRQLALKRWADFFRLEAGFKYSPYVAAAFPSIISPRLPLLSMENAQAPSAMLELFVTWANRRDLVDYLVKFDSTLLPQLYTILTVRNVKPAVILRVFDIVSSLLEFASEDGGKESEVGRTIIQPGVHVLLVQLGGLFAATSGTLDARQEVGQRQVTLLCSLAPYVESQDQAANFLTLVVPMLRKTNKQVPEKIKTDLLRILTSLYPLACPESSTPLYRRCYEVLSSLFSSTRTRQARLQTTAAFSSFASVETSFAPIASLIEDLNSYSKKRSEEPDFDRRLAAYSLLNEDQYRTIRPADWVPIINNMLFFIQDPEELAIRSNASFALRRFVEIAGASEDADIQSILVKVFLPGLRNSLHSKLEIVRSEILGVYASAVEKCSGVAELDQLKCLLVDGDQEANFFYNINHIQIHRRTRALRRLADEVEAGSITSKVVADIFLPLLDQFILGAADTKDPDLVNETVQCLARLAKHLVWSAYYKLAHHYLKFAKILGSSQKACVRALVGVLKGFHFDLNESARLLDITTSRLLPELLKYLEKREEVDEEIRIPVAEGISAVVQHLPADPRSVHESSLLMALSQILRSRDQHVRDLTRITICNIVSATGNDTLPIAVKELRRALARGPQLHVLAFTVHAMLVRLAENSEQVDFDAALEEVVPVLGDDCFGTPAKDRGSQEFRAKTKFREVRSYKSVDSFQILARFVSPNKISSLLSPIRDVLQRTDSGKTMKEVEDVFKAFALGLTVNTKLDSLGVLDLTATLVSQNATFLRPAKVVRKGKKAAADYHVQLSRHDADERDFYSKNAHRFVSFGLELFNAAFRKSQFDLDDPVTISRLEPLVSLVGNTLYSDEPIVLARSMRATASLIRCPLASVTNAAPVLVKQMISIVQRSGSTESELAQSSLRTLAIVIRDCKSATLKEEQLTELLQLIGPDLEEADRQGVLFQLLRAIMSRKFVAPEIYDLMDKVAEILVTNQSANVREICRSIYLQFLLDYPQGRGRLKSSLAFLAKNLSFVHESGRLSVLELLNAILTKFAAQLIQESADLFFVGLVMVIANDESTRCREMAAELVKILFGRVEKDAKDVLLTMLHTWSSKKGQAQLSRTAIQLFGTAIEALGDEGGREAAPAILEVLGEVLEESYERLQEAEEGGDQQKELETDWQLPYQALQSLSHVYKSFPSLVSPDQDRSTRQLWLAVRGHLLFPHIWIRTSSARLLGSLYATSSTYLARTDLGDDHPLSTPSLLDAAQKACLQLKSPLLSETLAMQIVKNLFFAAKCFNARHTSSGVDNEEEAEDEEDGEERQADPLRWLFTRLSYQARQAHIARPSMHAVTPGPWSLQPASILRWFAAVVSQFDKAALERFLVQMATPIFRISEDPNAQDPQMAELQTLAHEVQELLQAKVGTTAYSTVHTAIRQKAAEKRNEKKRDLALAAINDPAADAKRKAQRANQKAAQRKRKNAQAADQRGRLGSSKRHRHE